MKISKKNSPPCQVVESIRKEMTNPNFPYKNIGLIPDATPLEKNKYDICQKILAYKQDNKLTTEKVAKSIQLTAPETEDIFFGRINKFTLDRLMNYATKLGIILQIKEIKPTSSHSKDRISRNILIVRKNPNSLVALRKLEQLDKAKNLFELTFPPHNRLEALRVIMTKKKPTIYHPGKILGEEFLIPAQISSTQLAHDINVPNKVIREIIAEERDLNKEIATRLALYFRTAPTFWINLQSNYDEEQVKNFWYRHLKKEIQPLSHYFN
ncbi:41296_t:CDS:2 [Gigaspora margarita]|uniref:41296_t:CDS:1 n=1 Tax=Gigaspora margarita TaxID=4874 RepID=A0ABN7UF45_GIGMA|nr:41296_t:CDS:2 [Gigaspora margarita]